MRHLSDRSLASRSSHVPSLHARGCGAVCRAGFALIVLCAVATVLSPARAATGQDSTTAAPTAAKPAAPAAMAPAAASQKPATQRIVVFFEDWSALLGENALAAISNAADQAKAHPKAPVLVQGFATPVGSKEANYMLSKLRAQMVVDKLVEDGIARGRIRQIGNGTTDFTLSPIESRRVEIAIGGR